jgi:Glycosyltransferase WbsX
VFGSSPASRATLLVTTLLAAAAVGSSHAGSSNERYRMRVPPPPRIRSAQVGAYFFGGWSGPTSGFHFKGLITEFKGRKPFYGWRDGGTRDMSRQLAWAHAFGVGFFVFDWYFQAKGKTGDDPHLDDALRAYLSLRRHNGVRFTLMYVNSQRLHDFTVRRAEWPNVVAAWARLFASPDYVRIAGKPVLVVYDALALARQLGGTARVNHLFSALRASARARGLAGVFIVGGVYVGSRFDWAYFPRQLAGQTYDALTQYSYPAVAGAEAGERCYCQLVAAERQVWEHFGTRSPWPFIPSVMAGWDPRPWSEHIEGSLFWFRRTPAEFARFVRGAIRWSKASSGQAVTTASGSPIVLVEAWNELGEGSYIVPTAGSGDAYGKALRKALSAGG